MTRGGLPTSWAEVMTGMAQMFGGTSQQFESEVHEWLQQAVKERFGATSLRSLDRLARQLAFQKASGVMLHLQDHDGDLGFTIGNRAVKAAAFARYFDGVALEGPPWALDPTEGLPHYEEWAAGAEFGAPATTSVA